MGQAGENRRIAVRRTGQAQKSCYFRTLIFSAGCGWNTEEYVMSEKPEKKRGRFGSRFSRALFLSPIAVAVAFLLNAGETGELLAAAWHDPLAVLAGRSPGTRDAGVLVDSKSGSSTALAALGDPGSAPWERVLGPVRYRPDTPLADDFVNSLAPLPALGDVLDPGLLNGPNSAFPPLSGLPALSPPGGGFPSGPSGPRGPGLIYPADCCDTIDPGSPDPGPGPGPGTPTDPVSPVPEPGTWLMFVLGMLAVGRALRERVRRTGRPLALLPRSQ